MSSVVVCILMYIIEQYLGINYLFKTIFKILLFISIPLMFFKIIKKVSFVEALNIQKLNIKQFKYGILFGVVSFFAVLLAYVLLKEYINFESIIKELNTKSKITVSNFIFVGVYITLGNSFLEEFFFRGYIFMNLYENKKHITAYLLSSLLFALYHIGIFQTWFNLPLTILALVGLFSIGIIFNWLCTKSNNLVNSWIVHILADASIILIGLNLFSLYS